MTSKTSQSNVPPVTTKTGSTRVNFPLPPVSGVGDERPLNFAEYVTTHHGQFVVAECIDPRDVAVEGTQLEGLRVLNDKLEQVATIVGGCVCLRRTDVPNGFILHDGLGPIPGTEIFEEEEDLGVVFI